MPSEVRCRKAAHVPLGSILGFGPDPRTEFHIAVPEKGFNVAQSLLEQIMDTFEDAEKVSERFKKHANL